MIAFNCPSCDKPYLVPEAAAGRRARCKQCGGDLTVPAAGGAREAVPAAPSPGRPPARVRRLMVEAQQMREAFADFPAVTVTPDPGDAPDRYRVDFAVAGLAPPTRGDRPVPHDRFAVEIVLPADFPRLPPVVKMRSAVFHPNIDETTVCVGDHWTAGERLADLVVRVAEMLAYQAYNIRSPLNGEAAMWADLNADKLPTDPRDLRPASLR